MNCYLGFPEYFFCKVKRILAYVGHIENNVYHFFLTDHQRNNRVVANNINGTVV